MSTKSQPKSKKELYEDYLNFHDLESLISEMTNSVVHSQDPNPIIYMIKYLAGLLTEEERAEFNINILPPYPQGYPIVKFPNFQVQNVLKKYLTRDNWYTYKHRKTSYNNDINNLTYISDHSKSDKIGLTLVDNNCISCFEGLVEKVIYDVHEINPEQQNSILYKVGNSPEFYKFNFFFYDLLKEKLKDVKFIFYRNIEGYTYNNFDKRNSRLKAEIEKEIQNWIDDGLIPKDMSLITDLENFIANDKYISKEYQWMKEAGFINKNYTLKDRAIYSNDDNSLIILINFANHFEIISTTPEFEINNLVKHYNKIMEILKQASVRFTFDIDPKFGYLTSDISLLGAGLKLLITTEIQNKEQILKAKNFIRCKIEEEEDNKICLEVNYKLKHQTITNFLGQIFIKLYIINLIDNGKNIDINGEKIVFKDPKAPLALAYDQSFSEIIPIINFKGTNINELMTLYKEEEDDKNFLLCSSESYFLYDALIKKYIEIRDGVNLEINGHMSKPEEPRNISNIESRDFISSIMKLKVSVFRNVSSQPFPIIKNFDEFNEKTEDLVVKTLNVLNSKKNFGTYKTLEEAQDIIEKYEIEIQQNERLKELGFDDSFPEHRGIIQFEKPNIFATVNDMNSMTFILNYINPTEEDNLREGMENLIGIINTFSYKIPFSFFEKFGFLTAQVKYMGTGIKIEAELKLPTKNRSVLNVWLKDKAIKSTILGTEGEYDIIRLENTGSFGQSETEMLCNWLYYLSDIAIQ